MRVSCVAMRCSRLGILRRLQDCLHDLAGDRRGRRAARCRVWFCRTTAIASSGGSRPSLAGEGDEPRRVAARRRRSRPCRSCRRPSTPGIWAAVPVPRLDGAHHHRADLARRRWADGPPDPRRLRASATSCRSGSTILSTTCGSMRMPPLPIAPATIAICSGVTSSRSWPNAIRPGVDVAVALRVVELAVAVEPARRAARPRGSRAAAARRSRSASPCRGSACAPSFRPMLQNTELTEYASAVARLIVPNGPRRVEVVHPLAVHGAVAGVVERRVGRVLPRLERRGGRDDLERRAREVEALRSRG